MIAQNREIINLLKKRNQQAISLILTVYGEQLYGFIYHHLQSEELAVEAMKKVCLNIWKNSLSYSKKPEHLFIWLLRIAKETVDDDYLH